MKKVLLGLSGGVDSSVSAALLKEEGYEVTGATMRLHPYANEELTVNDAKRVCNYLDIDHIVLDFTDIFKKYVINNFINEYKIAHTPNPCIICNEYLKFGAMLDYALDNGYDYIATGHYADVRYDKNLDKYLLHSSPINKDQSYFLYRLKQNQLKHILFPLNKINKDEVRNIAKELGLPVATKKDSQEICFIPDNDYRAFLLNNGVDFHKGNFIDKDGKVLGEHKGIINYTIGQRKGLGISFKCPMFVSKIDALNNTVTLSEDKDLYGKELICTNISLTYLDKLPQSMNIKAKIRFRLGASDAHVFALYNGDCKVVFDEPQRAITKGQSVVFYDNDVVIGGGFII